AFCALGISCPLEGKAADHTMPLGMTRAARLSTGGRTNARTSRLVPGRYLLGEDPADVIDHHACHLYPLGAAGLTGEQLDLRLLGAQKGGDEVDDRLVGPAPLGWGGHLDLDGIAIPAGDGTAARSRLDV